MLKLPGRSEERRKREMEVLMQLYKGSAYASDLQKATDIPESTIYRILETLKEVGAVIGVKTPDRTRIVKTGSINGIYNLDHSGGSVRTDGGPIPERYSLVGKYMETVRLFCAKNELGGAAQQAGQSALRDDAY